MIRIFLALYQVRLLLHQAGTSPWVGLFGISLPPPFLPLESFYPNLWVSFVLPSEMWCTHLSLLSPFQGLCTLGHFLLEEDQNSLCLIGASPSCTCLWCMLLNLFGARLKPQPQGSLWPHFLARFGSGNKRSRGQAQPPATVTILYFKGNVYSHWEKWYPYHLYFGHTSSEFGPLAIAMFLW